VLRHRRDQRRIRRPGAPRYRATARCISSNRSPRSVSAVRTPPTEDGRDSRWSGRSRCGDHPGEPAARAGCRTARDSDKGGRRTCPSPQTPPESPELFARFHRACCGSWASAECYPCSSSSQLHRYECPVRRIASVSSVRRSRHRLRQTYSTPSRCQPESVTDASLTRADCTFSRVKSDDEWGSADAVASVRTRSGLRAFAAISPFPARSTFRAL
jgi:hypothetical protein